ncbi:hypothetical protein HMPREF3038_01514 [Akkermansia sp. KLE1797]|nr:hypothetical protein HMPREF3038_01514 [Akkermansia sp. KLE1797]KXU54001.1 hypothetical protein HMPREF3039_01666 [Akkermansia sp. KLE1798]KZA05485.1 hypothetical protein HMPREF1326_00660 [Akkermansia sp. KLE1605]
MFFADFFLYRSLLLVLFHIENERIMSFFLVRRIWNPTGLLWGNNPVLSGWFSIPYPGKATNPFHFF